jgi:hypothetical protein
LRPASKESSRKIGRGIDQRRIDEVGAAKQ